MLALNRSSRLTSAITSLRSNANVDNAGLVGSVLLQSLLLNNTLSAVATPGGRGAAGRRGRQLRGPGCVEGRLRGGGGPAGWPVERR